MDALSDGLGGLDTSLTRPLNEVAAGSYNFFANGDLLVAKVTPCFENGKKAYARELANGVGFATSEVHVVRPDKRRVHPQYLFYILSSEDFRAAGMASMTGAGGLRRVSEAAVLDYRPSITCLNTQKTIVDFLDRETSRIDQLIEKKNAFAKRLWEREDGHTRNLLSGKMSETHSRMTTSAPWLDSVPAHWRVFPLRRLVRISTGGRDTQDRKDDGAYPFFVRSMNICHIPEGSMASS
ncbi:hypothetical protein [Roseovarius sp. MBR-6]|jgi:type I restriction enzyme S subunit|uniref:restriction endonuclease subunit S n=1 Tax=Roseovarius sp. MBR-6 TaxID=3156459 RepID=UPI00339244EF